ncbi:hypothetical protein T4B_315 [Trichinella pseudospiralis]|uniref:Uncharacterized protein n=1 Tax=Trichinella pseudospiralis TaxID=6337 RepID=A0A0V1GBM5_TRIPS|nr:hypothetical protein T4C_5354 [Trichinella pseudospiralis]KRY96689.1 hypothetical protein T4B_315 [Trichinella pseudospiralis]
MNIRFLRLRLVVTSVNDSRSSTRSYWTFSSRELLRYWHRWRD